VCAVCPWQVGYENGMSKQGVATSTKNRVSLLLGWLMEPESGTTNEKQLTPKATTTTTADPINKMPK